MLRRALWSAWRWRSTRFVALRGAMLRSIDCGRDSLTRRLDIFQSRGFGVANVWIDEETAASRPVKGRLKPKKRKARRPKVEEEEEAPAPLESRPPPKPLVFSRHTRRLLRKGAPMRQWKDGSPRPPGREGALRRLDSGKILGRNRAMMIDKYGMPKRIPRKLRLQKLEKRRERKELLMKMAIDPELKEKVLQKEKLREEREPVMRMNKMERRRAAEEREAAVYFSQPLKSDEKKVSTLFGEMDVTAAMKYKELKARKREEIGSGAPEVKKLPDPLARLRKKALAVKREAEYQKLLAAGDVEQKKLLAASDKEQVLALEEGQSLGEREVPKCVDGASSNLVEKESDQAARNLKRSLEEGLVLESKKARRQAELKKIYDESARYSSGDTKRETETEKQLRMSQLSEESKAKILDIGKPELSDGFQVELVNDIGAASDDERSDKWMWGLDSTRPMDDSAEGLTLSRILGTNALLGFPRLTKAKKPRPRNAPPEKSLNEIIFEPQPDDYQSDMKRPTLFQPEERSLSLERQIIEKTLEEYHMILQSELATPQTKPRIRRVLKIDKDDITFKRYETPEERKASGKVEPRELSANARFRMIQPSRELMRYIDSQLLGKRRLEEWRKAGYNVKQYSPLDNVPFFKGEKKHRIHQSIFRNKLVFVAGAKVTSSIPPAELPEIAFAGRTNAGKSKLINALARRYGTARTSPRPGKTDALNFYVLGEKLCLVDMPGYSFMYGKEEKIEELRQLTKDYITIRDELKRICLLIDAQWGIRQKDQEFIEFLESVNRKYQIVLTKTDKVLPLDLGRRVTQTEEMIKDCKYHIAPVMMVSAKSGAGIGRLRMTFANLL